MITFGPPKPPRNDDEFNTQIRKPFKSMNSARRIYEQLPYQPFYELFKSANSELSDSEMQDLC